MESCTGIQPMRKRITKIRRSMCISGKRCKFFRTTPCRARGYGTIQKTERTNWTVASSRIMRLNCSWTQFANTSSMPSWTRMHWFLCVRNRKRTWLKNLKVLGARLLRACPREVCSRVITFAAGSSTQIITMESGARKRKSCLRS